MFACRAQRMAKWLLLFVSSSILVSALRAVQLPAALLLSMSPGGMDTAVVIAATTNVSLPLVLAAQLVRLIMVMIAGPSMAKVVAGWHRQTP